MLKLIRPLATLFVLATFCENARAQLKYNPFTDKFDFSGALIPGTPPGGIGGACTNLVVAYLSAGQIITCAGGVWTVSGGSAGGTVSTFSGSGPSWLTWTVATATTTPAVTLAPTTGQTSHLVIGTCGTTTTFAPCALVLGDLPSGLGLTANPLSQFAATTSAQLAGVLSDETGTGLSVFNNTPTLLTPTIASFTNATHNHSNAAGGGTFNTVNASNCTGTPSSTTFLRGDCTWATPAGTGTVTSSGSPSSGNMAKFSTATNIVPAIAGTDFQAPISLTTTGTSGAATFAANVLNIPQYTGGGCSAAGGTANAALVDNGSGCPQDSTVTIDSTAGRAGSLQMPQGTAPSSVANSWGWLAPTSMTTSVMLESPNAVPAANQIMLFPAPTSNISQWAWTNFTLTGMNATFSSPLSLSTNTVTCPTCVVASSPGVGIAHFAGSTQTVTSSLVSLTADVTGVAPLANGGTNANITASNGGLVYSTASALALSAVPTAHGVIVGEGAAAPSSTSAGTSGQCFLSNGSSTDPSFQACPGGAGAGNSVTSTTPVTVNTNTTSDQQLMELSLGAGYFNSSKQPFLFDGAGVYTTQTAQTPTITLKIKLCTVSGCGSGTVVTLISIVSTATVAAVSNNNWNLSVLGYTATTGTTGNLEIHGPLAVDLGALTTTADSIFVDTNTAVSSNIDLTAALFVDFTIAFSTNAATANTFTQRSGGVMPFAATAAPVTSVFTQTGAVGNLTGDVTTSGSTATTIAANAVTSSKMAVVNTRRVCDIPINDTSGSAITSGQMGPQSRICYIPAAATIVEMDVNADAGTPNVIVGRNHAGTIVNIVSSALATAASGGIACSNTGGTTGINGATTCSSTLQNTSLSAGDYLELVSGTPGGTAKFFVVHVIYTVN